MPIQASRTAEPLQESIGAVWSASSGAYEGVVHAFGGGYHRVIQSADVWVALVAAAEAADADPVVQVGEHEGPVFGAAS
jgi:hypothetical protein